MLYARLVMAATILAVCVAGGPGTWAAVVTVASGTEAQHAFDIARPGDEIVLADGQYPDLKIEIAAKGETSAPITLRARSTGHAVLTGRPQIKVTGTHIEVCDLTLTDCAPSSGSRAAILFDGAGNCRLTSCTFRHCRFEGLPLVAFRGRAHDNRVDHCRFFDTRYRSVVVVVDDGSLRDGPPMRNRIDHNIFQDVPPLGKNGGETVQIGQRAIPHSDLRPATIVEDNLFVRCNGEAEIVSVKTSGNMIRGNVFRDCEGELVLRHGHDNTVENNRFDGCLGGIRVSGAGHRVTGNVVGRCRRTGIRLNYGTTDTMHPASYLPVHDCVISRNTILDCGEAAILVGSMRNAHHVNQRWAGRPWFASAVMDCTAAPRGNVIESNILTGAQGVLLQLDEAAENTIRDNLFQTTGTATIGTLGQSPVAVTDSP